jgi:hypothetical protein
VLWNNRAGELWHTFVVYLRRHLAEALSLSRSRLSKVLRVEYAKVAEYQSRGLVHFHAVIRLDSPSGSAEPPPASTDMDTLCEAITNAARAARVHVPGHSQAIRWGTQLDLRPINYEGDDGWTDAKVARYIAKYATKGAETAGTVDRPFHTIAHLNRIRSLTDHARHMIRTCWNLHETHPHLKLRELDANARLRRSLLDQEPPLLDHSRHDAHRPSPLPSGSSPRAGQTGPTPARPVDRPRR